MVVGGKRGIGGGGWVEVGGRRCGCKQGCKRWEEKGSKYVGHEEVERKYVGHEEVGRKVCRKRGGREEVCRR